MKSSQLKEQVISILLESLNEGDAAYEYAMGKKVGVRDRIAGKKQHFDPNHYPAAFIKGYNEIQSESWWQKFNEKLTDWLARMGSSRLR